MKLLAVADIHGSQYRLNLVLNNITNYRPELVVVCGDITQFGSGKVATNFLNQLSVQSLALPGNIDPLDVDNGIKESTATDLHLKHVVIKDIEFIGIGRDIPSSLADIKITDGMEKKPLSQLLHADSVLVTHIPPYKIQDKIFVGTHGGSKELRNLIDKYMPRLVLCGHIHEDPGVTISGKTTIVNCSMGKRTEGAIVDISKNIKVTILD